MSSPRWLFLVSITVSIALALRLWVCEAIVVASGSMEPTLAVGTHLFVDKLTLRWREPLRGDIVIFPSPVTWDMDLAKRWYGPHRDRLHDDAVVRRADVDNLERMASGYASREPL